MLNLNGQDKQEERKAVVILNLTMQLYDDLSTTFSPAILDRIIGWGVSRATTHFDAGRFLDARVLAEMALEALIAFKAVGADAAHLTLSQRDQVVYKFRSELLKQCDAQQVRILQALQDAENLGFTNGEGAPNLKWYLKEAAAHRSNGDLANYGLMLWYAEHHTEPLRKLVNYTRIYGKPKSRIQIVEVVAVPVEEPAPQKSLDDLLKDLGILSQTFNRRHLAASIHDAELAAADT